MIVKKKVIIERRKVHYVGYRPFLSAKARRLRIPNYEADNTEEDGKEKNIVSVGGEEKQIQEFMDFIKKKYPTKAKITDIREAEAPEWVMPIDEYDKVLAAEQQNTVVQSGLAMIDMQKQTLDNQRKMLDKQDETTEVLGAKIDNHAKKTEDGFSKTDQNFTNLRDDYGKISKDLTKAIQGIEKVAKNTEKLLEKSEKDRVNFEKSINKLANAILKLAEKTG